MTGGAGNDGVAERGEERAGVKGAQILFRVEAEGPGACNGGGIGDGAGALRVAVDAIGAGAEVGEHFAGMVGELEGTGESKLLIAAAGARSASERDGDFAAGDEAEAAMKRAQLVEAIEKIAGRVGVIPV